MNYAEVAVNSPGSRSTFSYAIPPGLSVSVGQAVWVPFGTRVIQGIVIQLAEQPSVVETREIVGAVAGSPVLSPVQIRLARWISERYFAPLFDALALMLPPGFERRTVACFQPTYSEADPPLTPEQRLVLDTIEKKRRSACLPWRRRSAKQKPVRSPTSC
ncbi:MAG: hypothetical protein IBX67_01740 [Dehalococcoidia bacterium]|nr:hypothetical protein [Dehalococcoidia bacterium]